MLFSVNDDEEFDNDHDYGRTVVITADMEPNFTSGAAAWTPDEGRTWFQLRSERLLGSCFLQIREVDGSSVLTLWHHEDSVGAQAFSTN